MKKLSAWIMLVAVTLTLAQCKKSQGTATGGGNANGYYVRFKLNGNSVEYDSDPFMGISFISSEGVYTAVLAAYKDVNSGLKNAVDITVFSADMIAAGVTYNDPGKAYESNSAQLPQSEITWYDTTANAFLTAGILSDAAGNIPIAGVVADSKFTITDLASTYAKGTFSGTVYRSDFQKSDVITDGEFYVKRNQ